MRKKLKTSLAHFIKISIAGCLIFWFIQSGLLDFKQLLNLLKLEFLIPCILLVGFNFICVSERWRYILLSQNIYISFNQALKLTLIGIFFNFAFPGGVGGDVAKGYYIAKNNPQAKLKSIITLGFDRLVGLYCMISMALLAACILPKDILTDNKISFILPLLLLAFTILTIGLILLFNNKSHLLHSFERWLHSSKRKYYFFNLYEHISDYKSVKAIFGRIIFLSLAAQLATIGFFLVAANGLGLESPPVYIFFFIVPVGFILTAIPISPGGIGVGQAAFYFLFNATIKDTKQLGPAIVTALQIITLLYGLIGAIFYIKQPHKGFNNDSI